MAQLDRLEVARVVVAPLVALFVAAIGWVLTTKYNATQLEISIQKSAADLEVARINAALRYVESLRNISEDNSVLRRQTVAIAAPVLPSDLAFRLAVDQLPDDPIILSALMSKYGSGATGHLVPFLELPLGELKRVLEPFPETGPYATQPTELEQRAGELLRYARARGLSQSLFDNLVSDVRTSNEFRTTAILLYLDDYRHSMQGDSGYVVNEAYTGLRAKEDFRSHMRNESFSSQAKQEIALAASIVFGQRYEHHSDLFVSEAAGRFWDGVDIARGATPAEGTVRSYVYEKVFHYNYPPGSGDWYQRAAVDLASASLRDRILALNWPALSLDNVRLLLYAFAASPTAGNDPAYLVPSDAAVVLQKVLDWANSPEKRKALSMELGSMMGDHLFRNLLPSSIDKPSPYEDLQKKQVQARCAAARHYAEVLIAWYQKFHARDWYIPKFFDSVANEFPELEFRIDRKSWGMAAASELGANRGCRL